jgi:hypothetical protein
MTQEDLNCSLVGVCDLFDVRAGQAIDASKNEVRSGGKPKATAKRYRHYTELLANDDIDAVVVATPDHWHSRITMAAAKAGKHVYCEKVSPEHLMKQSRFTIPLRKQVSPSSSGTRTDRLKPMKRQNKSLRRAY